MLRNNARGMTLVELLVLIAIVGVLASLTIPLISGCAELATNQFNDSVTFVGTVVSTEDLWETDDDNYYLVRYADILPNNAIQERFTVEDTLPVQAGTHYAFRVWPSIPHRHVSEAIQIPKGW